MKHFTSKYFIRPIVLNWIIGVLFFYEIFLSNEILKEYRQQIEVVLILIYFIATLWTFFYLLFYSIQKQDIQNEILRLEKDKEKDYSSIYKKQELLTKLSKYRLMHKNPADNSNYVHLLNSKDEITDESNSQFYLFIFLLLLFGQNSFDYLSPIGPIIFIALILVFMFSFFRILFWELLRKKSFMTPIVFWHIILIYFLFVWGKNSYVRNFGNEIIGSYFEKYDYKTKYYVKVSSENEEEMELLPAEIQIHIESESDDRDESISYSSQKIMTVKKIFLQDGEILKMEDCDINFGDKVSCYDRQSRLWKIELTNEKVK